MTEDEIGDLFREMREDAVPADSLALVRLRLRDRIRRRALWRLTTWVAACAVIALAAFLIKPGLTPHIVRQAIVSPVLIRIETPDPDVVILLVGQ